MKVGIFPLNIVLYPDSYHPLHIFEERYKDLFDRIINDNFPFCITLLSASKVSNIASTGKIEEIYKVYDDGRLDILVKGLKRVRINMFYENQSSYYKGEIEYLEDIDNNLDVELLRKCIEHYNFIVNRIPAFKLSKVNIESLKTLKYPSYLLAQKSGLIIEQRQHLLEILSENERLAYLLNHLETVTPNLESKIEIDKVIRNDGYLPPDKFREL